MLTKQNLIDYYSARSRFHEERAKDPTVKPSRIKESQEKLDATVEKCFAGCS